MALAGFFGAAAQTTDDSMREWRRVFQEDEKLKETRRQFDLSHALAVEAAKDANRRWETDFNFREEIERMRVDLDEQRLTDERITNFYDRALVEIPTLSPEDRLDLAVTFRTNFGTTPAGMAFADVIDARISSVDYISRDDALRGLNQALNSDPGTLVFAPIIDRYLESLSEEEQEQYGPMIEAWKSGNAEDWASFAETKRQLDALAVAAREAEIATEQARGENLNADTFIALGRYDMDRDLHEHNIDLITNAVTMSDLEVERAVIDAEYYPTEAAARARTAIANATSAEAAAQVANLTVREQIDTIVSQSRTAAAQAGLAEEDLRFNLATAGFREAAIQWQAALAEKDVEMADASLAQVLAYTDVLQEQVTDSVFKREQAAFEMIGSLVESGNVEMLDVLGEDILSMTFGENWQEVQTALSERALTQRSVLDRRAMAAVIFEEFRAEDMKYEAENNERVYLDGRSDEEFRQEYTVLEYELRRSGQEFDQGNIDRYYQLAVDEFAHRQVIDSRKLDDAAAARAADAAVDRNEVLGDVASTTRINQGQLAEYGAEITLMSGTLAQLGDLEEQFAINPDAALTAAEGVIPLLTEYGISVESLTDGASVAVAAQAVQNALRSKTDHFIRSAGIFITNARGMGVQVSPEELGLNTSIPAEDDLWEQILLQDRSVRQSARTLDEATQVIAPALDGVLRSFAPALVQNGTAVVTDDTVQSVWNAMTSTIDADKLSAAGYDSPEGIYGLVSEAALEYQAVRDDVESYSDFLGTRGISIDYNNPQVINAAAITINNLANGMIQTEDGVLQLPVPTQIQSASLFDPSTWNATQGAIDPSITSSHSTVLSAVEEVYGIPILELRREGFVSEFGGTFYVNNPTALATYLQDRSQDAKAAAQALANLNTY